MLNTMTLRVKRNACLFMLAMIVIIFVSFSNIQRIYLDVDDCKIDRKVDSSDTRILLNADDLTNIVDNAKLISTRPVLVTLVNDGYYHLASNWLCHTQYMAIHAQVLVITTQHTIKLKLINISRDIHITVIRKSPIKGDQEHGHAGYMKLLLWRTHILNELLNNDIQTLLFECDSLWIKNPLPLLRSYEQKSDMLSVKNYKNPGTINGGFFYLFPTNSTKTVFQKLLVMLNELYSKYSRLKLKCKLPTDDNDQEMLSRLIQRKHANINVITLPYTNFADGVWYDMEVKKRNKLKPYIIHNDYIVGNKAKMMRFKAWGHWFLDESDNHLCNTSLIKNMQSTFNL